MSEGPARKKGFGARLAAIAGALESALDAVGEVVQSAGELLVDNDLRRKGAQYIVDGASRGIDEAQRGIEAGAQTLQAGARARIGAGARQLQNVLRNIERQIQDFQKQQQQRDLQAELEHHHKLPVDIQVGHQVLEDMPQEMRSRFWYVLLQRPDLAQALLSQRHPQATSSSRPLQQQQQQQHSSTTGTGASTKAPAAPDAVAGRSSSAAPAEAAAAAANAVGSSSSSAGGTGPEGSNLQCSTVSNSADRCWEPNQPLSPFASYCGSPEPSADLTGAAAAAAAADAGSVPERPSASQPAPELATEPAAATAATSTQAADAAENRIPGVKASEEWTDRAPAAAAAGDAEGHGATLDRVPDIDDLLAAPSAQASQQLIPETDVASDAAPLPAPAAAAAATAYCSEIEAADPVQVADPVLAADVINTTSESSMEDCTAAEAKPTAETGAEKDIGRFLTAVPAVAPNPWGAASGSGGGRSSGSSSSASSSIPSAASPWAVLSPTAPAAAGHDSGDHNGTSSHNNASLGGAAAGETSAPAAAGAGEGDGWELVSRDVPSTHVGSNNGMATASELETLATLQSLVYSLSAEELSDPSLVAQQAVFKLMTEVPWQSGTGIPSNWQQDEEYAALVEAGCGSIEEVILRDVPRTFPEHPLFSADAEGQQRLLRLLKAYAAADPEVGYCQGMAFAAGVLLMYLPEEVAFRLYRRIMSSGPTLRRLYLPGLDPLKLELSRFELLLATHSPQLHKHLLEAGLPALLYAAQWLMTCYSCPFPVHVAGRVLDVLLQSDSDAILPRLGLAVMGALQEQLLEIDDFEALITFIKVKPLSWPLTTHRQVINAAMDSPASLAELAAATAAVQEEFARLGRPSSFSARHLSRLETTHGSTRHELAPRAPSGAAAVAVAAAAGSSQHAVLAEETGDAAGLDVEQQAEQQLSQHQAHEGAAVLQAAAGTHVRPQQASSSSVLCSCAEGSGVLGEIDLHLLQEMDMLVVGDDGVATSPAADEHDSEAHAVMTGVTTAQPAEQAAEEQHGQK